MTKDEAIQAMKQGKKVTHRYFASDEYVCIKTEDEFTFEDGVTCSPQEFFSTRNHRDWETDWEIFQEVYKSDIVRAGYGNPKSEI